MIVGRAAGFGLAEFRVDPARRSIVGPNGASRVEPRVMDVLVALARRAPNPVTRDELINQVWGGAFVTDGVLTRCISILRERLGDERGRPRFIETLAKHGYRLIAPVTFVDDEAPVSAAMPTTALDSARTAIPIVVLPFVNLRGDGADEHLSDGLTELLTASLAGVASLRVIARTSAMAYKRTSKRIREIAADLGVDYLVEGSVLGERGRVQVVVQLIDARTELHLWAQIYTRELRDVLTLLNEVARAVANAMSVRLHPREGARLGRRVAIDEPALQHYLKGRYFWAQRGADPVRRAIAEFAACASVAPDFAPAHIGLADSQILLAMYGIEAPLAVAALAREHLARALALDPDSPEALTAQGATRLFFDWDLDGAERAFARALAMNPSYTNTHLGYGDLLMMRGEFDRGLELIRDAVKLSPLDLGLNMNVGDFLIFARRFNEAVRHLEHLMEMDPRFVPGRLRLAEALALEMRHDAALTHAETALAAAPSLPRVRETHALVLAAAGRQDEARGELAVLVQARRERYVSAWEIARAFAIMGDADEAIRWLYEAIAERAPMTLFAGVHPTLDPIRGDPRYPAMLSSIGVGLSGSQTAASQQ